MLNKYKVYGTFIKLEYGSKLFTLVVFAIPHCL